MSSTKQMQARAKANKQAAKQQITCVPINDMDQFINSVQEQLKREAVQLISVMSPANIDLTLLDSATFSSKKHNQGGKQFEVQIHCKNKAVKAISNHMKKDLVSVVQVWNGYSSVMIVYTEDQINDACFNYRGERRIKEDDLLSATVAAMRLNAKSAVMHHLAMHCAYDYKQMDAGGIAGVWD
jgi:hypothetical protein